MFFPSGAASAEAMRPIAHKASGVIRSLCSLMLFFPMFTFSCALVGAIAAAMAAAIAKVLKMFIILFFLLLFTQFTQFLRLFLHGL